MKKTRVKKLIFYGGMSFFLLGPILSFGQTIKRQCISSYAAMASAGEVMLLQTAGQTYHTGYSQDGGVLQGFQQSENLKINVIPLKDNRELNMAVFPNPTSEKVIISGKEEIKNLTVQVFNSQGNQLYNRVFPTLTSHELNCHNWENGIYFIRITDDTHLQQTLKLIISK